MSLHCFIFLSKFFTLVIVRNEWIYSGYCGKMVEDGAGVVTLVLTAVVN